MKHPLLSLLALAALPLPLAAQALSPDEDKAIDTVVTTTLARTGVPSVSIAVVRDGTLVMARAWGKASDTLPVARAIGLVSCIRLRQRTKVDLPQPEGPISAVAWFAGMCRSMSCSVCVVPYHAFRFTTWMSTPTNFLP